MFIALTSWHSHCTAHLGLRALNQNTGWYTSRRNMAILPMENSGVHKRASFRQKQWYRHVH